MVHRLLCQQHTITSTSQKYPASACRVIKKFGFAHRRLGRAERKNLLGLLFENSTSVFEPYTWTFSIRGIDQAEAKTRTVSRDLLFVDTGAICKPFSSSSATSLHMNRPPPDTPLSQSRTQRLINRNTDRSITLSAPLSGLVLYLRAKLSETSPYFSA